jgi:cbb3-type cytochrome oxidase maturation protein
VGGGGGDVVVLAAGDGQQLPRAGAGKGAGMTIMLYLIGVSLVMGGIGLVFFLWCLRSGQYDDLEGAANRILFDDPPLK